MNKIYGPFVGGRTAVGLLLIRIALGAGIAYHGWGKVSTSPFHWADGMGIPSWLQGLAALSEFGGGLALIVGLLTPLAMFGLACTMIVAWSKAKGPGFELVTHYLAVAIAFIISGPGAFSLDALIFGRRALASEPAPTI